MSTNVAPDPNAAAIETSGQADGSTQEPADRAQEAEETGTAEGELPSEDGASASRAHADKPQPAAEPDDRDEKIREYEVLLAKIEQGPYGSKVLASLRGDTVRGADEEESPVAKVIAKHWPETFTNSEGQVQRSAVHPAMKELVAALREELRSEVSADVGSKIRRVQRDLNGTRYERALETWGVSREDQGRPEFLRLVRQLDRDQPDYRTMGPEGAARFVAREFAAIGQARTKNVVDRRRIEDAKGARLNGSSPRGGATSKTTFASFDDYIKARTGGYDGIGQ